MVGVIAQEKVVASGGNLPGSKTAGASRSTAHGYHLSGWPLRYEGNRVYNPPYPDPSPIETARAFEIVVAIEYHRWQKVGADGSEEMVALEVKETVEPERGPKMD